MGNAAALHKLIAYNKRGPSSSPRFRIGSILIIFFFLLGALMKLRRRQREFESGVTGTTIDTVR